jgi:hypothetical protein
LYIIELRFFKHTPLEPINYWAHLVDAKANQTRWTTFDPGVKLVSKRKISSEITIT